MPDVLSSRIKSFSEDISVNFASGKDFLKLFFRPDEAADFSINILAGLNSESLGLNSLAGFIAILGRYGLISSLCLEAYGNLIFKSLFFTDSKLLESIGLSISSGLILSLLDIS